MTVMQFSELGIKVYYTVNNFLSFCVGVFYNKVSTIRNVFLIFSNHLKQSFSIKDFPIEKRIPYLFFYNYYIFCTYIGTLYKFIATCI